ncbi:MAG TPA: cytochrome c biogenesis protein [Phycisphaerae bacterium]|nr:cytochrome c biogenesis protein [Phycisphaerae bacterium]
MTRQYAIIAYWLLTAVAFIGAIVLVFTWTPEESSMGVIQKIFYFHLPVAINTFLACAVVFVASVGYLVQRDTWWDDLAAAAANIAVVLCTGVLLTGMLWAHGAWGVWWTWSPRLTFSFMLWLLYVVYLLVRSSVESAQRRALVSAVFGLVAFLDVPLVYLSARLLPDIHPGQIALAPEMKLTLGFCMIPITLLAAGLICTQYKINKLRRARQLQRQEQFQLGVAPTLAGGSL